MRKPRDYDAELKALEDRAKQLRQRKVQQFGELVVACGADVLSPDYLAGALLGIAEVKDAATKEGWRKRGAAFFQGPSRKPAGNPGGKSEGTLPL
ncbi:MAG: conjugal transfer protein TraD [Sphingomicrobium sp.]